MSKLKFTQPVTVAEATGQARADFSPKAMWRACSRLAWEDLEVYRQPEISDATQAEMQQACMLGHQILIGGAIWHEVGRPYYKVWPGIAEALGCTKMEFDGEHLQTPFPAFAVMLPDGYLGPDVSGTFLVTANIGRRLYSPAAAHRLLAEAQNPHDLWQRGWAEHIDDVMAEAYTDIAEVDLGYLGLTLCFRTREGRADMLRGYHIFPGSSVDRVLNQEEEFNNKPDAIPMIDEEHTNLAVKVAVGVMMFATNQHQLVLPDVRPDELTKRFPEVRGKAKEAMRKLEIERYLARHKGWAVGQEIDLPRPQPKSRDEHEPGQGSELSYGHIRSGYMRMQPHGPRHSLRKLQFIHPTIVREDLPMRPTRGYRLQDKLLP